MGSRLFAGSHLSLPPRKPSAARRAFLARAGRIWLPVRGHRRGGAIPEYGDAAETASMTGRAKELVWSSSRFFGLL
jgi:hypothetical protein